MEEDRCVVGDWSETFKGIASNSVRLILTDPPYNLSERNFKCFQQDWDRGFDQTAWLEEAARVLVPGGSIVSFNDYSRLGTVVDFLEHHYKFMRRQPLVWRKTNPFPRNRDIHVVSNMEFGIWATKPGEKHVFNRLKDNYETFYFECPIPTETRLKTRHPCKKPQWIFEHIIKVLSNEGELVVDPFVGGGTTALAARATGRRFIVGDQNSKWITQLEELIDQESTSMT